MLSVQRIRGNVGFMFDGCQVLFFISATLFIAYTQVDFVLRIYPQEQTHSSDWQTAPPTQRVGRLAHHPSPFFQP